MKLRSFTFSLTLCLLPSAFCPVQALTPDQALNQFEQQLENSYQFSGSSSQLNSKLKTQNSELKTPTVSFTPSHPLTLPSFPILPTLPIPPSLNPPTTIAPQYIIPAKYYSCR